MNTDTNQPHWNPAAPYESLQAYTRWLHGQAVAIFEDDKTHAHILFLFTETDGLISVTPLPPGATEQEILAGVRQAIKENDIYGVVTVAEAWMYLPKIANDHTVVQLLHNEMRVADLKDEDREECLMVRMECRDGDGVLWLNPIIRAGEDVTLGDARQVSLDDNLKRDRYFV